MSSEPPSESAKISERLGPVIAAAAERIHYAEARRSNYTTMGGALIAAGIAILTFALGAIDEAPLYYSALFGGISMFGVGAATVWLYGRQTNRYPFTDATKTWKWFYRDALSDRKKFELPWGSYFASWEIIKNKVQDQYASQLSPFKNQVQRVSDDSVNLEQDIEQLYVLHINELYKNIYLSHIRTLFNGGIILILLLFVIGAAVGWVVEGNSSIERSFVSTSTTHSDNFVVRLINSPLSKEVHFIAKATVTNKATSPLIIDKIVAQDASGWPVQLNVTSEPDKPVTIPPGASVTFFLTFTVPASEARRIKKIEARTH
jgi:hypothetical protein